MRECRDDFFGAPERGLTGLKRQCHEIFYHYFFAYKISPGPHMNRQNWFCELFRFREDIQSQSSKIAWPRIRWLRRHANFSLGKGVSILLSYCYLVYKHIHSFKICEKHSKFSESICVVRYCACVVNKYAEILSFNNYFSTCSRSQQLLYVDTQFLKISN